MEDKNIIINETTKYNFFAFFNINQPLTNLTYFNSERLVFTKPVTRKLPNNNINFNRVFIAISGPKTRIVTEGLRSVYDVNELLDYDSQTETTEFATKYDFSKLEDNDYHVLIDYEWFKANIDSNLDAPSFVYNMTEQLYHDEPAQREAIMSKFTVFNATELYKKKPTLINKIPTEHYHILITKKWVKDNLSEKYLKTMNEEYKPLVFSSEEVFSFGVARNTLDTNSISYQISLCLYDRETPKDSEIKWAAKYEELATVCREYLKKSEFKKLKGQIDAMKGLSWKCNEIGDADGPKLYPKIMFNQKKEEFITVFMSDENLSDEIIEDPKTILDKRCKIKVALRFESIFIGSKVALQVRVNDVLISKWIESYKPRALIVRRNGPMTNGIKNVKTSDKSEESDLNSSSSEEEEEESKPVKRVVKTVKMST